LNDYDNSSIVARMRIEEYRIIKRNADLRKRFLFKGSLITFAILWCIAFACKLFYYIEYDVWIT